MKKSVTQHRPILTKANLEIIVTVGKLFLTVSMGIGLMVLFGIVVRAVLYAALRTNGTESWSLLNTVLTLVTASLSAAVGFAFGRTIPSKKDSDT